ncbi:MAG TPA: flagellar filament capping protein FliD [Sphingobium sp.]
MATNSIADTLSNSLGLSYGLNVSELVTNLVAASKTPKQTALNSQLSTNASRISALASAKSSLTTFSTALTELLKSSDYSGQPASSNDTIASVSIPAGATGTPAGLPAQLQVTRLATAQVIKSATIATSSSAAVAGTGTLTLTVGSGTDAKTYDIALTSPKNTLADLATAINDKKSGVTASVVTDSSGTRIVMKGATGSTSGFTLAPSATSGAVAPDSLLSRFTFDGTTTANSTTNAMTRTQEALNAQISIDGVAMEFPTNVVDTAIPNLRIDLNSASPGTSVTLATNQPVSTMSDLVQDFVSTYNTMKSALNLSTRSSANTPGLLSNDSGVRDMSNQLAKLTSMQLSATGPYKTLADIGVSTNRDGTLTVDTARLSKVLADNPAAVTQMLNPTTTSTDSPGLGGALKTVTDYLNAEKGPLATSSNTYDKLKTELEKQLDTLDTKMTDYEAQLTKTYTAMQTRLTAMKATQTYLTQQIDSWNNSKN